MSNIYTTLQTLAIAVLKDDPNAIQALLDELLENYRPVGADGQRVLAVPVLPAKKITVDRSRLRVAIYIDNANGEVQVNHAELHRAVNDWLDEGGPLSLIGVRSIELFELPENFRPPTPEEEGEEPLLHQVPVDFSHRAPTRRVDPVQDAPVVTEEERQEVLNDRANIDMEPVITTPVVTVEFENVPPLREEDVSDED